MKELRLLEVRVQASFERAFPPALSVKWKRGHYRHAGIVVRHGAGMRVRVLNLKTDREVWIRAYDIVQALQ